MFSKSTYHFSVWREKQSVTSEVSCAVQVKRTCSSMHMNPTTTQLSMQLHWVTFIIKTTHSLRRQNLGSFSRKMQTNGVRKPYTMSTSIRQTTPIGANKAASQIPLEADLISKASLTQNTHKHRSTVISVDHATPHPPILPLPRVVSIEPHNRNYTYHISLKLHTAHSHNNQNPGGHPQHCITRL